MDIDLARLKNLCTTDEFDLWKQFAKRKDYEDMGLYLFKDAGSKILTVAHLDVFRDKEIKSFLWDEISDDIIVHSPSLDDRLGVYVADHMMPNVLKLKTDVLLTTDEEMCQSTAKDFAKEMSSLKEYNWIVEFDRSGEDVVLYHYDDVPELTEDLMKSGFDIGIGSYSDIGELEDFKVGCFNVGIGYHHQHTVNCFASMQELVNQLVRFRDFYKANYDKKYIYTHKPHSRWSWLDNYYGLKDDELTFKYGYESNLVSDNGYIHTKTDPTDVDLKKRGYLADELNDEEYYEWVDTVWDDLNEEQKDAFMNGEWEDLEKAEQERSETKVYHLPNSDLVPYGTISRKLDTETTSTWKDAYRKIKGYRVR